MPGLLGPHQRTELVDGDHLQRPRRIEPHQRPEIGVGGGVVHQHVEGAESLDGGLDAGGSLLRLTGVGRHRQHLGAGDGKAQLVGGGIKGILFARADGDHRTLLQQGAGDPLADAP